MPRRKMLTDRQRAALLDLPTEETAMLRHYTLADDDPVSYTHLDVYKRQTLGQTLIEWVGSREGKLVMKDSG